MVKCIALFVTMTATLTVQLAFGKVSQVHLGVSSSAVDCPNGIAVSFATDVAKSYLVTGTADGTTVKADSTFVKYSVSEAEHNYAYTSPFLHTALLCDLDEMTKYSYTIGDSEFTGTFVSLLHSGSDKEETILGVIGDPGDTTFSEATFAEQHNIFEGKHIQALVIVGDYSYANGLHAQWDNWFTKQQAFTSTYPLIGINGNHETITSSGHLNMYPYPPDMELEAENYLGYIKRVYTPITEEAKKKLHTWYSVNIGLIHCVFLDDYTGSRGVNATVVGTDEWLEDRNMQLEWVKTDLESVDRSVTPWVVVFRHNPYYNTWIDHQCQCSPTVFEIVDADKCWNGTYFSGNAYSEPQCGQMAKLEDVFSANGVNAIISGHVHAYERTAKIFKNVKNTAKGIYYVTTGSGGNYEGHAIRHIPSSLVPSWSLVSNNVDFGGSRIIATRKSFRFLWFANNISTEEAVPTDGFTIFAEGPDITTWPQTTSTS